MGLAFSLCSPQAQARIAELTKQKATPEDIQAEIGRMAAAWLESLKH